MVASIFIESIAVEKEIVEKKKKKQRPNLELLSPKSVGNLEYYDIRFQSNRKGFHLVKIISRKYFAITFIFQFGRLG